MELKHRNNDEHAQRFAESVLASREKETYTREELKNELVSAYCFACQKTEVMEAGEYGNFGQAIEAMRRGFKVARAGWNGKGMFLWMKAGSTMNTGETPDPAFGEIAYKNGGSIEVLPTICMKTADNKVLTGWLASQTDMLANDWYLDDTIVGE